MNRILAAAERHDEPEQLLDKAVDLARRMDAHVDLLITEAGKMGGLAKRCTERGYDEVTLRSVHRGSEPLLDLLLRIVQSGAYDFVVKTPAAHRDEANGDCIHDEDWRLAGECPIPLFIVRSAAWATPARLAVTLEVDDTARMRVSREALKKAEMLALEYRGSLDILYSERAESDSSTCRKRASKVDQLVRELHLGRVRLQTFSGPPELRLRAIVQERRYDVVVLGVRMHDEFSLAEVESTARLIASAARGDVMFVPGSCTDENRIASRRRLRLPATPSPTGASSPN